MTTTLDTNTENQLPGHFQQTNSNSSQHSKSTFELEPNPFEQSFAKKDQGGKQNNSTNTAGSPQISTPGGRKLPPLVLSPNVPSGWGANGFPRTGLTPNESSLRTGLTPGGANFSHSLNGLNLPGLNTPGSLGFANFTPGLSSLLGTASNAVDQSQSQNHQQSQHQTQQMQPIPNNGAPLQPPQIMPNQVPQVSQVSQVPQQSISNPSTIPSNGNSLQQTPEFSQTSVGVVSSSSSKEDVPVSIKRGRKRGSTKAAPKAKIEPKSKKQKTENKKDDVKDEGNDKDLTEEEKRKNFLERNRVAASKCRQRKKQQQVEMKNDLKFYLNEYNNLTATIDQLKEQALALRGELLNNKIQNPQITGGVENILTLLNSTNYLARLRGNAPSSIVPTVQPINPALVQQPAVAQGPPVPVPQAQQLQQIPGQIPPQFIPSNGLPPQ